jgi:methyltransferase (TIGR00027 family)
MRHDRPSATASLVARNLLLVHGTKKLSRFVRSDAAQLSRWLIQALSPRGETFVKAAQRGWFQLLFRLYERLTIPGLALHQAIRKYHVERIVRASLSEGFDQIVILGGGLDTLALRLHKEFPKVNFLELDHPATQRVKREVAENRQLIGENLTLLPLDLTERTLEKSLAAWADWRDKRKSVFLCEGVLMYLEPDQVNRIFASIGQQGQAATRLVFTFMEPDKSGRTNFRNSTWFVRLWLSWKKEPFKWGLRREKITNFLEARGFSPVELVTPETFRRLDLHQQDLRAMVLAEGENICVCDVNPQIRTCLSPIIHRPSLRAVESKNCREV